jgi:hypothetical protein
MTSSGIETATFQLVAKCLNQLRYRCRHQRKFRSQINIKNNWAETRCEHKKGLRNQEGADNREVGRKKGYIRVQKQEGAAERFRSLHCGLLQDLNSMSGSAASQGAVCNADVTMLSQLQKYINTVGMATGAEILADKRLWRSVQQSYMHSLILCSSGEGISSLSKWHCEQLRQVWENIVLWPQTKLV